MLFRSVSVSDPQLTIGESIMIVYLPSDPSINDSSTHIDALKAKQRKRQERRQKRADKWRR